jgi:hypothetical protein
VGTGLVAAGQRSDSAHALASALAGAINEHDGSLGGFLSRWWRARTRIRRNPDAAGRKARIAVPCEGSCGCGGREPAGETSEPKDRAEVGCAA